LLLLLEKLKENSYTFELMKLFLVIILFLSFAGFPPLLLVVDDAHSVAFANEHGISHLIFFHSHDSTETSSTVFMTTNHSEDHHEFHLSPSSAVIKKQLQFSFAIKGVPFTNNLSISAPIHQALSVNLFEADIGAFPLISLVLRI
jgi:hypothetical protein